MGEKEEEQHEGEGYAMHVYLRDTCQLYSATNDTVLLLQLYIRRSKYVISTAEREKWQQIDSRYMTDEYSSDEDSSLSLHHPTWRSVGKLQWPSLKYVCMYDIIKSSPIYGCLCDTEPFVFLQNLTSSPILWIAGTLHIPPLHSSTIHQQDQECLQVPARVSPQLVPLNGP